MKQKYLFFGDKVFHGFGNQLRALIGWYRLSKILNRQFILNNTLINSAFNSPFNVKNFSNLPQPSRALNDINVSDEEKSFFKESCKESNILSVDVDLQQTDFNSIADEAIECGGGKPMLYEIFQNHIYKKELQQDFDCFAELQSEKLSQKLFHELFPSLSESWEHLPLFCPVDLKSEYSVVQFRTFSDAGWEGIHYLDEFIFNFPETYDKYSNNKNVFVTSDDPGITQYICHSIQKLCPHLDIKAMNNPRCECCKNRGFLHSSSEAVKKMCGTYPLLPIKDWLIIGKSNFMYCSGTSFTESAAQYFGIPYFFWDFEGRKGFKDMSA